MKETAKRLAIITFGAILYAVGINSFIIPNGLFDNGTTGISVLIFYSFQVNLSLVFLVLNFPFWIIGYRFIGRTYGLYTVYAVIMLSLFSWVHGLLAPLIPLTITRDILISAIFGGVFLGLGVGLIIKNGGSLDGVETTSIILAKKTGLTIGEIALSMNLVIMFVAGLIFGMDKFFYSLISYFVSSKVIDLAIEGFNTAKNVFVISEKAEAIATVLMETMHIGITYISAKGGYTKKEKDVIMLICTRFNLQAVKKVILGLDPNAFIVINDVHEVTNGRVRKK